MSTAVAVDFSDKSSMVIWWLVGVESETPDAANLTSVRNRRSVQKAQTFISGRPLPEYAVSLSG